ncbi:MAG: glutamine--fructose-6-phosphate transaminase (isomerizing), partial [Xanthomonadales bacterium]|nr:glutamine--fructose-6-phosphate transaminase (isomerizing) [Xanthomonadales bacterium]
TRWATHGVPNTTNAHPHLSGSKIALVHNGIIENHAELRNELTQAGYTFGSETDTEVMVHLIDQLEREHGDLFTAVSKACERFRGAYAIAVTSSREPETVVGARLGSPLVLGIGEAGNEHFLASDVHALLPETRQFIYLEEGDLVRIRADEYLLLDADGKNIPREVKTSKVDSEAFDKGPYPHFMLKEIHEQPGAVAETLEGRIFGGKVLANIFGVGADELLAKVENVHIVACGTSYYAGMVARYQIEELAGIPCSVEIASEYRYRKPVVPSNCLYVTITQSGETLDTLSALRHAKKENYLTTLVVCNVPESSAVRESELILMTRAGPEIGVASTKAFTTQLAALQLLTLRLAQLNGMDEDVYRQRVTELEQLPGLLASALELSDELKLLAKDFADKEHALYLGRGDHYPIALEGALKLKEISYIHAEAYPAGELKHGPLALVDENMPVVAVAPNDSLTEKLVSNIAEVKARGGRLIVVADREAVAKLAADHGKVVQVETGGTLVAPIVLTIPLQLLAYHVAILKGTEIDQPRNLAKSVTVE